MRYGLLLTLLLLASCAKDDFADLREFMAKTAPGPHKGLEPLPTVMAQKEYTYDPSNLLDPFRPRSMKPKGGGVQPDINRPKGPLEQEPLDSLRMVGTLFKDGKLYALVRRPDGTLYRVTQGDHIGQNFGVILNITESMIEIKEIVQDGSGDWIESKATVALQE